MTMTPDEWLADFESKVAEMQRKAASFRRDLEEAGQTVTSEDGKLTVIVAPNGALLDLKIDDSAVTGSGADLAAAVMALVRQAREGAATHVVDAFRPLAGNHVDDLDTDVSVPAPSAANSVESEPEEYDEYGEDFGGRSVIR